MTATRPDRALLGVVVGYAILYAVLTWPLALHPATCIVSKRADGFFDMLLFWYARRGELLQPSVSSLFHPWGAPLGPEQAYWLVPYLSVPLQWIMPLPLVFNLICATFFIATGASTWALARRLGASEAGGFVGGAMLVMSPAYLNEIYQGIPENMAMQWLVGFLLFGLRAREDSRRLDPWACGGFFVLCWLTSWYLGLIATICLPLLPLRRLVPALLVAGLLLAVPLARVMQAGQDGFGAGFDPALLPEIARAGVVVKPFLATTELDWRQEATRQVVGNSVDLSSFLARYRPWPLHDLLPGTLLVGLALLGAWRAGRGAWRWLLLTALFTALAVGPVLLWNGRFVGLTPVAWLYHLLPLLARMRASRFMLGASLALAVLAAFAMPRLRAATAIGLVVLALVTMQYIEVTRIHQAHYAIQVDSAVVPAGYALLEAPGAIIDYPVLPGTQAAGQHLYAQTVHGRAMLNYNFVSFRSMRQLQEKARANGILGLLVGEAGPILRQDAAALSAMGFRYVVLHDDVDELPMTSRHSPMLRARLVRIYGPPKQGDGGLLVFDLQAVRPDAWDASGRLVSEEAATAPTDPADPSTR